MMRSVIARNAVTDHLGVMRASESTHKHQTRQSAVRVPGPMLPCGAGSVVERALNFERANPE